MTERPRILLVEDVADDAELALLELRRIGLHADHRVVDKEKSFVDTLREFAPDLILSDFSMPGFDGMAALALAREICPDTPFIFVSGTIGEEFAVRALKSGATDYVMKTNLVRLPAAVERALREGKERAARRKTEGELEALRERLRSVVSTLPDVVWSVAVPSREILYVSPATSTVFGRTQKEFYESRTLWGELIHPEDRTRMIALWQNAAIGETFEAEYRIVKPGGEIRWIQGRGRFAGDAAGNVFRMDVISRDVTERREHERKLTQLSRVHAVLSGINSAILRVHSRDELFRDACRIAAGAGQFRMAWVGVVDREAMQVKPVAWDGVVGSFLDNAPLATGTGGQSLVGQAVRERKPVISNDIQNDLQRMMKKECLERGINSLAALPLIVGGEAVGVLALYAGEIGFFDSEEMQLLVQLAGDIAFALEHIGQEERLTFLAYYDALTGLPNRPLFHERLTQLLHAAKHGRTQVVVAAGDINRFRLINDTFGRQAGDALLREFAQRLKTIWPEPDHVARISADIFAGALADVRYPSNIAYSIDKTVAAIIEAPFTVEGKELRIAITAGVAVFPNDGEDADILFRNAEAALEKAKESGERYLFYRPEMNSRVAETLLLENKLRQAIKLDQFVLHYQPKVDGSSRRISGLEALIRWQDPETGLVPPAKFIPILEETGMILEVGQWAIRKALEDSRRWRMKDGSPPRIAVNVSPIQLRQRNFVEAVRRSVEEAGGEGCQLDLEITEGLIMRDIEENIQKLSAIREMGLQIAIDDFGTGYSSLAYLAKLPVNALKIDRSFIITMASNPQSMTIVSTIISLAHSLGLKVIAEGVDAEEQAKYLRLLSCDEMQGYLFSRPVPPDKVEDLLNRNPA